MQLAEASSWVSPEGITAAVTVVLLLLSVAKNVAQGLGKKEFAARLGDAETKAETFSKITGSLVKGVDRVRREGRLDPKAVTELVATLKEENLLSGVEHLVAPIVAEVKAAPAVSGETAVRMATARLGLDPNAARRVS